MGESFCEWKFGGYKSLAEFGPAPPIDKEVAPILRAGG